MQITEYYIDCFIRLKLPAWLLGLPLFLGVEGSSRSRPWLGVEGVGALWFLSSRGFTSSWRTPAAAKEEPSFFSASRFPAALAATSLSKAAEEVIDTSERKDAARVELADCGLNGELKASKRAASSPRPPPPPRAGAAAADEAEVEEEDDGVEEEATALLSWSAAFAAAFNFWIAESGERLEPQGVEQLAGGHLSATPAHTKPLPLLGGAELKGSRGSCLMLVTEGAKEAGEAEPLLLLLLASFRARALKCWAWWEEGERVRGGARPIGGDSPPAHPLDDRPSSSPVSSFSEPASRRRRRLLLRGFPRARDAASPYSDDTTEESVSWAENAPPSSPRSSKEARWTGVGQPSELSPPQASWSPDPAPTPSRSSGEEPLARRSSSWVSP
ncbi:hypothetical protein EYF80_000125 [Liparis tanakae]|uniref:Uncharacterized protein n=1 Tax=Liparis tanakae TaxID=230148 RepID=A0A4Z2JJV4_9TELE|nr:hypothetical protein EYF80_000125 [Liparis tanakae]